MTPGWPEIDARAFVRIYFTARNHPIYGAHNRRICRA